MTWYNKYRPKKFDDVIGQELIKRIMRNSIEQQRIKHAYLLSGPHGVGKTTLARIFAQEINQTVSNPAAELDIIEMDAASHTSIEDIRNLIESSRTSPIHAPYKIFIIDEVHMLSKPAMNALLKVLEEPPEYLIFLLATTNPEKLIETVLSRVSQLKLQAHSTQDITGRLEYIASQEGVHIQGEALELIAEQAKGSQRDAINILETIASNNLETYDSASVSQLLGLAQKDVLHRIGYALATQNITQELTTEVSAIGIDGNGLLAQLLTYLCKKSLSGDRSLDSIIPAVAEVLAQKLPLPDAVLVLAVIQSHFTPTAGAQPSVQPIQPKKQSENTEQPIAQEVAPPTPESTPPSEESIAAPQPQIEEVEPTPAEPVAEQPKEEVPAAQEPVTTQDASSTSETEIYSLLAKLQREKDTPPTFKMILPDIEVGEHSQSGNDLHITLKASGIFLKQLQNPKLKAWIEAGLSKHLNQTVIMLTETRVGNKTPAVFEEPAHDYVPEQAPIEDSQHTPPVEEPDQNQENSSNYVASHIQEGEIFYSVFKKLPAELEEGSIPVTPEIPIPEQKNPQPQEHQPASEDTSWDEHAEEMFDLE